MAGYGDIYCISGIKASMGAVPGCTFDPGVSAHTVKSTCSCLKEYIWTTTLLDRSQEMMDNLKDQ